MRSTAIPVVLPVVRAGVVLAQSAGRMRRWIGLLALAGLLLAAASAHGGVTYTVRALGNLGDDIDTRARALNDSGQVVGWSRTSSRITHAFLWDAATGMQDLGALLPEGTESKAVGINNSGQVVGHWWGSDFVAHAFLYDPATGMGNLPGLVAGGWSYAYAINDAGQITGEALPADIASRGHAVLWDPATGLRDLGTLGGNESQARAVNNHGQVVGLARTAIGESHAFLWNSVTGMRDLGTLGTGAVSVAEGVNDLGQVVGYSETAGYSGCHHAFLWDPVTGIKDLGAFGLYRSHACGINDAGQIIGWAASATDHGPYLWFLYDGTTVLDVRDLVAAEVRSMVGSPNDINNLGQVVGNSPTYLMTLVPEPGTLMMLGASLAAFGLVRLRRRRR